ncbi:hypothetical protein M0813_19874 [Anaeramoeba flamelloides]|uniref:Calponin-homology (CH) domain-containing protein n=1 Tax=Anaeramoeba flamelloides TaxID=1746091 RepID=A0ABQ8YNC8_9EUKA|nr:hypothetical protein M0813_19874 [Anaeramoeba flamelloides]
MNSKSLFLWPRFNESKTDPISEQIELNEDQYIQKAVDKAVKFARKVLKYQDLTVEELFCSKGIQLCNLLNVIAPCKRNRIVTVAHLEIQQTENLKELQNTAVECFGYPKNDLFSITGLIEKSVSDLRQLLNLLLFLQQQTQQKGIHKKEENSIRNFYILQGEIEKIENVVKEQDQNTKQIENEKEIEKEIEIENGNENEKEIENEKENEKEKSQETKNNKEMKKKNEIKLDLDNKKETKIAKIPKTSIFFNKYFNQPNGSLVLPSKQNKNIFKSKTKKITNPELDNLLRSQQKKRAKNKKIEIEQLITEKNFLLVKYTIKNSEYFDGSQLINVSKWLKEKNNNTEKNNNKEINHNKENKNANQLSLGIVETFFFLNTIDRWERLKMEWVPPKNKNEFKKKKLEYEKAYFDAIQFMRCNQYVFPVLAGNNLKVFEPAQLIVNPKNISVVVKNNFTKFNCSWSSGGFLLGVSKQDSTSLLSLTLLLGSKNNTISKKGNVTINHSMKNEIYYIKANDHAHKHMLVMLLLLYQTQHTQNNNLKIIGNNPKVSCVDINTVDTSILPAKNILSKKLKTYFFNVNEYLNNIFYEQDQKILNQNIIQKIDDFYKNYRIIFHIFNIIKRTVPFQSVFLDLRRRGIIFNNGKKIFYSIPFSPNFLITQPNNNNKIIKLTSTIKKNKTKTIYLVTETENENKFISKSILFFYSKWKHSNNTKNI